MVKRTRWAGMVGTFLLAGAAHSEGAAGVVATDDPVATRAGQEILERGGNAVDAAVAAGFCLSVVRPMSCGIGGGGFMIVFMHDNPRTRPVDEVRTAIDFRERAPAAVGPDFYLKLDDPQASRVGGAAVAVPGDVAGLVRAELRYGALDLATVLAPAIRAAEHGFPVSDEYIRSSQDALDWFNEDPARRARYTFVWRRLLGGGALKAGDTIMLPEQATALRLIAERGGEAFYGGPIGLAVVDAARAAGGVMTIDDLTSYEVEESAPLMGAYRGFTLLTMPPPSSGGVALLQILGTLDAYAAAHGGDAFYTRPDDPAWMHPFVEAMKHAFADRAAWLGDPAFVDVPTARLLDPARLRERAASIDPAHTKPPTAYGMRAPVKQDAGTSHLSVLDAQGGAVACTQTINLSFGSKVGVDRYGFALNNEMDDFTTAPDRPNAFGLVQSGLNLPAPGKRPLSSMTPVIALDAQERVELVDGASGGPRIISGVTGTLVYALAFGMSAGDAVRAGRVHHQWAPDVLELDESWRIDSAAPPPEADIGALKTMMERVERLHRFQAEMAAKGHRLGETSRVGNVQLIRRSGQGYEAAGDLGQRAARGGG